MCDMRRAGSFRGNGLGVGMALLQILAFESPALDLDITLFIQLGIFLLLMFALYRFILVPYFHAFDAREALTKGAQNEAKALEEEASQAKAEYEKARQKAFNEAEAVRREEVAKANEAASEIIENARQAVQADMANKSAELERQLAEARKKAAPEIDAISAHIAKKILV